VAAADGCAPACGPRSGLQEREIQAAGESGAARISRSRSPSTASGTVVAPARLVDVDPRINRLTYLIIGCAMKVHTALGPGLLESAYVACLIYELRQAGLQVEIEVKVPLQYGPVTLECGFRIDLLVDGLIVVEVKCIENVLRVHESQLLTYLKLAKKPYGLLFNFNVPHLKDGIVRKANTY
jgi:GxxExxY protein